MKKFLEIFRFEFAYQIRRPATWIYFAVMGVIAYLFIVGNYIDDARGGGFFVNAPIIIANVSLFTSLFWLFVAASVAGDAAARDAETRMYSLVYTSPISKSEYLGGRFVAAFVLNALILLAVPVGILIAVYASDVEPEILGPFRPAAYVGAYFFIALPNAFAATAIQFSLAAHARRSIVSYLASIILYVFAYVVSPGVAILVNRDLGKLLNPLGNDLSPDWTPIEMSTRLLALEGSFLWNRLLWLAFGLCALTLTYYRFQFAQPLPSRFWSRLTDWRKDQRAATEKHIITDSRVLKTAVAVPQLRRDFDSVTRLRQLLAVAWDSFRTLAKRPSGILILTIFALFTILVIPLNANHMGVPFFPRAEYVLTFLTAPLTDPQTPWIIIPLLIIYYAGELVWRERDAGLSDISGAAPVPEWILFLGKYTGLGLMLVVWATLLTIAGVLTQTMMNYRDYEIGLFLKVLFGLQLPEYLLFACLALAVHVLVNQKHLGHLSALVAYSLIAFAPQLGIEHHLLVYTSAPNWSYADMRGFGSSLAPWLWFKFYWAAWAMLFAVTAKLFWVRSRESNFKSRLQTARARFNRSTAGIGGSALLLITLAGGFIFYNTNVLNEYQTASRLMEKRAEYERRFGSYENLPQPRIDDANLHVEIYPDKRAADVRGAYRLVNKSTTAIDAVHLATSPEVEIGEISFDRPATLIVADDEVNHRIYALGEPLQPGDAVNVNFEVHYKSKGFRNDGVKEFVTVNGSYFKNLDWLPAVGYQREREINDAANRRIFNLPARPAVPSLDDSEARGLWADADRITFAAIVGTAENQTAVAPGTLRRTWTENNRRYFEYAVDAPIRNEYSFFSADYAVREARWNDVSIQIFHHPLHTANVERMIEAAQASLDYYTKQFGAYPNDYLRFVENPGQQIGMHSDPTTIDYGEGSSRFDPAKDPRGFDFISAVVAHEIGHQWWGGSQLTPAYVEGAPLLVESLAWFSAMGVMEESFGGEEKLAEWMQETFEAPRPRSAIPLLRVSSDWFLSYRKGPLALYALSRYIGKEPVNLALRRLLEKHKSGTAPLPVTLDLYRELEAVTPESHRNLLHDLFAANTFWEFAAEEAAAQPTASGDWQVTLKLRARKVTVDETGIETEVPMNDWVEIGVFADAENESKQGAPLYRQMHRLGGGQQTITVTVPEKPALAGIDPSQLLIDLKLFDNIKKVNIRN